MLYDVLDKARDDVILWENFGNTLGIPKLKIVVHITPLTYPKIFVTLFACSTTAHKLLFSCIAAAAAALSMLR